MKLKPGKYLCVGICSVLALAAALAGICLLVQSQTHLFGNIPSYKLFLSVGQVSAFGGIIGIVGGLTHFWIRIDENGVTQHSVTKIAWDEVDSIRIGGSSRFKVINLATLTAGPRKITIPMFVFESQADFVNYLKKKLPWASNVSTETVPVQASRLG